MSLWTSSKVTNQLHQHCIRSVNYEIINKLSYIRKIMRAWQIAAAALEDGWNVAIKYFLYFRCFICDIVISFHRWRCDAGSVFISYLILMTHSTEFCWLWYTNIEYIDEGAKVELSCGCIFVKHGLKPQISNTPSINCPHCPLLSHLTSGTIETSNLAAPHLWRRTKASVIGLSAERDRGSSICRSWARVVRRMRKRTR